MNFTKPQLAIGGGIIAIILSILAFNRASESATIPKPVLDAVEVKFEQGKRLKEDLQLENARSLFTSLLDTLSTLGRDYLQAEVKIELAKLLIEQGHFQEAISVAGGTANNEIENQILPFQKAMFECLQSEAWIRSGGYSEAEASINRCKLLESKLENRHSEIQAYSEHLHGFLYQVQNIPSIALDHLQEALSIKGRIYGMESLEYASTLNNIANIYYELGSSEKAVSLHYNILNIREKHLIKTHPKIAATYGNLGNNFHQQGDYTKALEYHQSSLRIWNEVYGEGHIESAYSYNNLGLAYLATTNLNLARNAFEKSIAIKSKVLGVQHISTLSTTLQLAEVFEQSGDSIGAKRLNSIVSEFFSAANRKDHSTYLEAQIQLGRILAKEGKWDKTKVLFSKTLNSGKQISSPLLPQWINDFAELHLNRDEFKEALSIVQSSLDLNSGINSYQQFETNPIVGEGRDLRQILRSMEIKGAALLGQYQESRNVDQLKMALKTYERALEIGIYSRRLQTWGEPEKSLTETISRIVLMGIESSNLLFTVTNNSEYLDHLHQILEFDTSGRFVDLLSDAQARDLAHVPDSLKQREFELKNRLAAIERSIIQSKAVPIRGITTASIQHDRFITKKLLDDLVAYTERIYPRYYSLKHGSFNTSIDNTISHLITSNNLLIQYYFSEDQLWALVIDSNGLTRQRIDYTANINVIIDFFISTSSNKFTQLYFDQLHILYQIFLAPVVKDYNFSELIIFPSGPLNRVPFEALLKEKVVVEVEPKVFASDYPFIVKDYPITVGLSATLMIQQSELQLQNHKKELLAFGPVFDFEGTFSEPVSSFLTSVRSVDQFNRPLIEPLYGSESELTLINEIIDGTTPWWKKIFRRPADIYLRKDATEHGFKTASLSDYNTIHFATHSFADELNPVNSGILLEISAENGEDGILHASEIFGLNLNAELVVLSSCDSAFEFAEGFEGLSGFTKGFIYAGAKNVIASLWPSDDLATNMLMQLFYSQRSNGSDIAESLRTTKIRMMTSEGPISHPYYWAGFIHIGASSGQEQTDFRARDFTLSTN